MLAGFDFLGVFLGLVAQRLDVGVAEQAVAVERDLGVEHPQVIVGGDDQRVDLQHGHVLGQERRIELRQQRRRFLGQTAGQAERLGQRALVGRPDAGGGVDREGVDLLGRVVRDLLDVHAALGGGDHRDHARLPVDQQGEVEFLGDGRALFDVEAVDLLALGTGLVGHQHAAEHLLGVAADLGDRLDHADAALGVGGQPFELALAAPAGVDLALHDEDRACRASRRPWRLHRE
jgi:hypothetical protein